MKMKLMRKIDLFLGVLICYIFAIIQVIKKNLPFKPKTEEKIKKILVVKFLGIGSIILTTPAILALKDEFPGAEIYYLTFKNNKEIVEILGLTQKNFYIETKTFYTFCLTTIQTILKLRKERINLMFDFEFFAKLPLVIGAVSKIRNKAGFYLITEWWRKYLLTYHGYYNHYYHVKDIFLSLVYLVHYDDPYYLKFEDYSNKYILPAIPPLPTNLEKAKKIINNLGFNNQKSLIVINPNAGLELALDLKRWPPEYFVELINKLNEKYKNVLTVLIGSSGERIYVESIVHNVEKKDLVFNIAGETTLGELLGIFSLTNLFITIDSGPMHLASLIKTPTIGLFGAETPVLYKPLNENAMVLCKSLYSVPMFTIYNGKESLLKKNIPIKLITASEVFKASEHYLDK